MLALSPLVPPPRRRSVHRRGSLFPVRPATSSPRVDAGQDRSSLYPNIALASLFTLRILPCPNRVHTCSCRGHRRRPRNRAAEPSSSPEASSLSRLRRHPSCSHRRGRAAGTHPRQLSRHLPHLERKPKHPDRDHLVALLHLADENVLPPGCTSVRPSQCTCSSARTHAGEHPGVPPRSSPPWPSHRHAYALK
jgi:hypothetical protein